MRRINYIHQLENWPDFNYDFNKIARLLEKVQFIQGQLHGRMEGYTPDLRKEAIISALTNEVLSSCAIEEIFFNYSEVESAIARSLRIRLPEMVASSGLARGAAEATIAGISHFDKKLNADSLCKWHAGLFPGVSSLIKGDWRKSGLDIMDKSGTYTRFSAPPQDRLQTEMKHWLSWINQENKDNILVKSAIAQLWLLTLHPFEDGNGPISRIISLMLISASENGLPRYYAPSALLLKEKEAYFQMLEYSQKGNLDITEWIAWYLGMVEKSIIEIRTTQMVVIGRQKLEDKMSMLGLSLRQKNVVRKITMNEKKYFTSSEWAEAAGYSSDTALREIRTLRNLRLIQKLPGGGRSTRYRILL